ncbi:hypothetical protein GobsT_28210 [Gemmata obscuriglobus]|uniref:DUF4864 domain-containing protein n=1 Tax=Gemmata obscuriglobus TaxID=114 RepID=A0A2Z3H3P0_9BACT|nr:hypothetical protein [Gemmata obscuriglobus]AWM38942.1 hypothetical protein C1280_19420 [Gemmata obscuriglobus]QEG28050.1 hypothetical protein GobsT_28210 [Gemmata obscuriglobus]VTS05628.1 unnamed protein product [Gemmata obscuriglobus UQM 2246]
MTKPVLLAGVLGGVLGGAGAFVLGRAFPAAPAVVVEKPHEARPFADDLFMKLQKGQADEFLAAVRVGDPEYDDAEFDKLIRQPMLRVREGAVRGYGGAGSFEFFRETVTAPDLVRFTYLERYPRGCLVWLLYCYRGAGGWHPIGLKFLKPDVVL